MSLFGAQSDQGAHPAATSGLAAATRGLTPPLDKRDLGAITASSMRRPYLNESARTDGQPSPLSKSASLPSEDVLCLILCHVVAEKVARASARSLLATFGSLGAVLAAKEERLLQVCGDSQRSVSLLRTAHLFMKAVLQEPLEDRPIIRTLPALSDYLKISLAYEVNEVVRILFLNNRNALLKDEEHCRGSINHVQIYPREVVKRVIEVNACAIIIVHNHPSGDPEPSPEDINMTQKLARVLNEIGVKLHDHIIVGVRGCESMRSLALI